MNILIFMDIGDTIILDLNKYPGGNRSYNNQYYIIRITKRMGENQRIYFRNARNIYIGRISNFKKKTVSKILLVETYYDNSSYNNLGEFF